MESELVERNKSFSIEDVVEWVEQNNSIDGRFVFFETFAMRTVGSIDVERRLKPIKHNILTKKRNRLQDPKGVALFRASENLKHLMHAKKILGKKITSSL